MGPVGHSAISAGIRAGVWGVTGSPAAGGVALVVGVLTDVDHLFGHYQWYVRRQIGKIYLLLHAWEYGFAGLLVLMFVYYQQVLLAAVSAHLAHVAADHFHNRSSPWGYSITYRTLVGFNTDRITPNHNVLYSYDSWLRMIPLGNRLEPWYQRKMEPWFRSRISD